MPLPYINNMNLQEKFPKWIVEDEGSGLIFHMQKVFRHKEMATNEDKVLGGGAFHFYEHDNKKCFILYGNSDDFGITSKENVAKALKQFFIEQPQWEQFSFYFSHHSMLNEHTIEDALTRPVHLAKQN